MPGPLWRISPQHTHTMAPSFMGLCGRPLELAVSFVATTGFVLFGYDQGVMSGIITAPAFNDLFTATKDNSTMQGFVTAIYEIGDKPPRRLVE